MRTIGVDPGCKETAWVLLADGMPVDHGKCENETLLKAIWEGFDLSDIMAIEMIASYGMPVGKEVFETCLWIGRFKEAWVHRGGRVRLIYRRDVKLFHCETSRANDANIRAALIDRYGPGKDLAVGVKAKQGPLYGIKADEWSALAVALTADGKPAIPPLFREVPKPAEALELPAAPF